MNAKEVYEQWLERMEKTHISYNVTNYSAMPAYVTLEREHIILRYENGTWLHFVIFEEEGELTIQPVRFNDNYLQLYHKAGLISQQEYPSVNLIVRQAGAYLATLSALTNLEQSAYDLAITPVWINKIREMRDQLVDDYHRATKEA